MKKVLLLSVQDIINGSVIEDSVDVKLLSKTLGIAQEMGLKPIIGNDLYTGLIDAVYSYTVSGTSLSSAYQNLIEAAKPYLIAKTVSDFILINNYKVSNKGLMKLNDDSATTLSDTELENVKAYYNNLITTYKADLVKYLKDTNLLDFNNDVQISSESTGWFFGNTFNINNQVKQETKTIAEYIAPTEGQYTYQQLDSLRTVLLIGSSEIIASSVIEDNVDVKLLARTIQMVQETYLRPILSENIYVDILNSVYLSKVSGSTIASFYQDLLSLIKPYMVNKVVAEFIIPNNYKFSAKGLLKLNDNAATALGDSELESVKNYYDNVSTTYKAEIVNFLKKYILVDSNTDNNITSDATGWFLSDIKPTSIVTSNVHPTIFTDNDRYITGGTFNNNILSLTNNSGDTINVGISGLTFADNDTYVTGGTYNNGTAVFKTNSGTSFSVSGFYTGSTDLYTTGATLNSNILTFKKNDGTTYAVSLSAFSNTDVYVTGGTYSNGSIIFKNSTGGTFNVTGLYTGNTDVYVTGGTYTTGTTTFKNNTGGTFTIAGYYTGFSVTTSGTSGSSTLVGNNLNIPTYTLGGLAGVTGSGTTNYVPKWSTATGLTNSSLYVDGSGNLGLGTVAPFFTGLLGGHCIEVSGSPYAGLVSSSNNVRAWLVANDANSIVNFGSTTNHPIVFYTNNTENARLATSGNFLINTSTDGGYKLDVNGTSRIATSLIVGSTAPIANPLITALSSNGNSIEFGLVSTGGYRSTIGGETSSGRQFLAFHGEAGTTVNTYRTRGVRASIIQSDALGGTYISNTSNSNADNQGLNNILYVNNDGTSAINYGLNVRQFSQLSNMTLGTLPKAFSVLTDAATYGINMGVSSSGYGWLQVGHVDGTATAYGYSLQSQGGNVMIGTTTDAGYKLDIIGTTRISGTTNPLTLLGVQSASDTKVLTIDASGVVHTILTSSLGSGSGSSSTDTYVTGGTYSSGTTTLRNSTGGTITISGYYTGNTNAFVQNGNSFGTTARLGTNDNNSLEFETNNTLRGSFDTSGNFTVTPVGASGYFRISSGGTITLLGGSPVSITSASYGGNTVPYFVDAGIYVKSLLAPQQGNVMLSDNGLIGQAYTSAAAGDGVQKAHIFDTTTTLISGNKIASWKNNTVEKAYITYNGGASFNDNVLVGTTTDAGYKLDINGIGRFSATNPLTLVGVQSASDTKVLTIDASGVVHTILASALSSGSGTSSTDTYVTGGTYAAGTATFRNNTGGTFTVTGFSTSGGSGSDSYVTGGTYSNGTTTFKNNTGGTFTIAGYYTGATDVFVTGGTYANGSIALKNNTGGTINITGLYTGATDTYVTGGTYSNGTTTLKNNTGGTINITGYYTGATDVFVTGGTYSSGTATFKNNTGGTFTVAGFSTGTSSSDTYVTGGTYSAGIATFRNNTGTTFTVTGFTTSPSFSGIPTAPTAALNTSTTQVATTEFVMNQFSSTTVYFSTQFGGTGTSGSPITFTAATSGSSVDTYVTGGTYAAGTATFRNNTGGTFNVTGFSTGGTNSSDVFVTGGTYSSGTITFRNNTGGTFTVTGLSTGGSGSTGSTLSTKSGLVASGSFSGTPSKATVTFSSSFASTNYSIVVTGEDARIWTTESKSTGGFTINSNSNTALVGTTSWIAILNGEA